MAEVVALAEAPNMVSGVNGNAKVWKPASLVKSFRVIEVKSMEPSSMVSSAICSPSIFPAPLSQRVLPSQKALAAERSVEEAFVANVEDAMRENGVVPLSQRAVPVALTGLPEYESGVQAKAAPLPSESAPHENIPEVDDFTSQFAAFSPETMRFVVL